MLMLSLPVNIPFVMGSFACLERTLKKIENIKLANISTDIMLEIVASIICIPSISILFLVNYSIFVEAICK